MKQLNYVGRGKYDWFDVAEPKLTQQNQAIVRPLVMARCDGDVVPAQPLIGHALHFGEQIGVVDPSVSKIFGAPPFKTPLPVGHEAVVEVCEVGSEVGTIKPGDKAVVPWAVSCGTCSTCLRKLTTHCENSGPTLFSGWGFGSAMGPWGGMIADSFVVPFADHMLQPIPEGHDPLRYVSLSDNLADAWRTIAPYLGESSSKRVCVWGGGAKSIGLYAAGIAAALGASKIVYVDHRDSRLEIAEKFGAKAVKRSDNLATLGPFDIAVEASSTVRGINSLIDAMDYGGVISAIGFYFFNRVGLNLFSMYGKSLTLKIGVSHPSADIPDIMQFLSTSRFDPTLVHTDVHDYKEAAKVYGQRATKLVLVN
ncbi:MAG: alcohol dehydrogenase catalytic domain-containing protein [Bdellovibrionales bacterium]|nr:alcohol dehydrogenase catalytic domain-containing protein [Bdellovibrionales bacterium]